MKQIKKELHMLVVEQFKYDTLAEQIYHCEVKTCDGWIVKKVSERGLATTYEKLINREEGELD